MKRLSKVVWAEGMYLAPHHFQAQSRCFEDMIQFATATLCHEPYGLVDYELDSEAMGNGTASVVRASGVFPDGLAFEFPATDRVPQPRTVADSFPPTRESLTLFLAIPSYRPGGPNCVSPSEVGQDPDRLRYSSETFSVADENLGGEERTVQLGQKNIRLVFDTDNATDQVTVPLARVKRDASGRLAYDPGFIPPCLQISASERLLSIGRQLIGALEECRLLVGSGPRDSLRILLLHAISTSVSVLRHLTLSKRCHPLELYLEMARLGGGLCVFGVDSHPRNLPHYDHRNLEKCFEALEQHIYKHLELALGVKRPARQGPPKQVPAESPLKNILSIRLGPVDRHFYKGKLTDRRYLEGAVWLLAIRSADAAKERMAQAPRLVKLCSGELLRELVRKALPGLRLTHLTAPPSVVVPRSGYEYFEINKAGSCWERIVETGEIEAYIPEALATNPELEVIAILND